MNNKLKTKQPSSVDNISIKLKKLSQKIDDLQKQTFISESDSETSDEESALTIDPVPAQNSSNPVASGGVYNAISGKQDKLTFDNTPTQNSSNPVTSDGVYSALATKQNTLTAGSNISIVGNTISATDTTYTAGENITIQNGVISATSIGGGGADLTNIENQIDNILDEQNVQNQNINYTDVNLEYVKKYLSLLGTPTDPNYDPKPYVVDISGTVHQTFAEFDRKYNKTTQTTLTTPKMAFSANNESTGVLDLVINFKTNNATSATINVYKNGSVILTENVTFDDVSLTFEYSKTINNVSLALGNVFYATIQASVPGTNLTMTNCYAKLTAPNAEVINQLSPYFVEYFNGKYYISDCSSGTARIAEIAVADMKNMFCLNWVDTGIECRQYKTSFRYKISGSNYILGERIDYYIDMEDNAKFLLKDANKVLTSNFCPMDWEQTKDNAFRYATISSVDQCSRIQWSTDYNKLITTTRYNDECYHITAAKHFEEISNGSNKALAMSVFSNGCSKINIFHALLNQEYNMPFGTSPHLYFNTIETSVYTLYAYMKVYDKIVRHDFMYSTSNAFTFISSQEIGEYEEYFEGANNDYFVVKNGELLYFKKPII